MPNKPSTGGPAFPMPYSTDEHNRLCNMTFSDPGMSLLDYFAGQALIALIGRMDQESLRPHKDVPGAGETAYAFAQDMIEAKEKL